MANQQLTYPFIGGVGQFVQGERFIGKKDLVEKLRQNCAFTNFSIRGLPHTGKTSLVQHSIIGASPECVNADMPVGVVYIDIATIREKTKLFEEIVVRTYEILKNKITDNDELCRLERRIQYLKERNFETDKVNSFFESFVKDQKVKVIIILDSFDHILKPGFGFDTSDFSILSTIISPTNVTCIVISIRKLESLENAVGKQAGSVFSQLFPIAIVMKQFDESEMAEYWARLEPYFNSKGMELNDQYKKKAEYYAGNDPYLLDSYNEQNYINGQPGEFDNNEYYQGIKNSLRDRYESYISMLEEEGLLNTAIQVVLGPVYDSSFEKDFDRLKQYNFLRIVTEREKRNLMGYDMGYFVERSSDGNDTVAYVTPSNYFTLLFKKDYASYSVPLGFWEQWSDTFRSLQLLCEKYLIAKWGEQWSEKIDEAAVKQMLEDANKDKKANITVSPLLEYLRENSIGEIIYNNWNTFAPVFDSMDYGQFREAFDYVKRFRNHHAHLNTRFLTNDEKVKANEYLNKIKKCIDKWNESGEELNLTLKQVITPPKVITTVPITTITSMISSRNAHLKPNIELDDGEYLGQMRLQRSSVYLVDASIKPSTLRIDFNLGYRKGFSMVDFRENDWVVCKLRECKNKEGERRFYVVDIHPAE